MNIPIHSSQYTSYMHQLVMGQETLFICITCISIVARARRRVIIIIIIIV